MNNPFDKELKKKKKKKNPSQLTRGGRVCKTKLIVVVVVVVGENGLFRQIRGVRAVSRAWLLSNKPARLQWFFFLLSFTIVLLANSIVAREPAG